MEGKEYKQLHELTPEELGNATGAAIVADGDKYWLVRQDGTVVAPAPSQAKAIEFAKTLSISTEILTKEEYAKRFARELRW